MLKGSVVVRLVDDNDVIWEWSGVSCKVRVEGCTEPGDGYYAYTLEDAVEVLIDGGYIIPEEKK